MNLVDGPLHLPGVCAACSGGQDRQCVDTLQNIGNWRIYICSQCALRIAAHFGFVLAGEYEAAEETIQRQREALDDAARYIQELETTRLNVVSAAEIVPYLKKAEGRPRREDGPMDEAEADPAQAPGHA